jgi:hypothetical protein
VWQGQNPSPKYYKEPFNSWCGIMAQEMYITTFDEDEVHDSRLQMNNIYLILFQTTLETITYMHR